MERPFGLLGIFPGELAAHDRRVIAWMNLARGLSEIATPYEQQNCLAQDRRERNNQRLAKWSDRRIYNKFRNAIARAQEHIKRVLGPQFLPHDLAEKTKPIQMSPNPIVLLNIGLSPEKSFKQLWEDRSAFEARRALQIGSILFDLSIARLTAEERQPLSWITDYLIKRNILAQRPERQPFTTYHDLHDLFRYRGCSLTPFSGKTEKSHLKKLVHQTRYSFVPINGSNLRVLYQVRAKESLSIIRKMVVSKQEIPKNMPDIIALRFICMDKDELNAVNNIITARLQVDTIIRYKDRRIGGPDRDNQFSDPEYEDIEYQVSLVDDSGVERTCEIQLITLQTHCNVEYSAAPMNHRRYEARQLFTLGGLGTLFTPTEIGYGIDWSDPVQVPRIGKYIANDIMSHVR